MVQDKSTDVEPVPLGYSHGPATAEWAPAERHAQTKMLLVSGKEAVELEIKFVTSDDSFPCEIGDSPYLRTAVGMPRNRRDHAVYDRLRDTLLSIDRADSFEVLPAEQGYVLRAKGTQLVVSWRPRYFRDHLGYFLWQPTERQWTKPVAGWCSWMAHGQDVTEKDMLRAAEFFAEHLKDYGYDIIQMDDGFQRVPQMRPEGFSTEEPFDRLWTEADPAKFPSGLGELASQISERGLTPGIWIGMYLPLHEGFAGYVTDEDGQPFRGPWVNYAADATDPAAVDEAYLRTIRGLREQRWRYFKLDTLRHVLYDSYRLNEHFWQGRGTTSSQAFRHLFEQFRTAVGEDIFCLACWGVLPEIAGLPDGCRIGEDVGPKWESIELVGKHVAQFHYLNNVLWLNDPDYMCFRLLLEQCRFWASLLALTCSQLMVSDPVDTYDEDRLDILRRIGPPLFGRPRVVNSLERKEFVVLQVQDGEEAWTLVGRFAWEDLPPADVNLQELGLGDVTHYAWDFWKSERVGEVADALTFGPMHSGTCTVISLHPSVDRPFTWRR